MIALREIRSLGSCSHHLVNHLRHVIYISLNAFEPRLFHLLVVFVFLGLLCCVKLFLLLQCLLSAFSQVCCKFAWSCFFDWLGIRDGLLFRLLVFFRSVDAAHVHRDAVACELNPLGLVKLALLERLGLWHGKIDAAALGVQSLEAILLCSKRRLVLLSRTSWLSESIQVTLQGVGMGLYMVAYSREFVKLVLLILSESDIHFLLVTRRLCLGSF